MFQHFGQRLKRDLKQIVDRRLELSAVTSGSTQKVLIFGPFSAHFLTSDPSHLVLRSTLFHISVKGSYFDSPLFIANAFLSLSL